VILAALVVVALRQGAAANAEPRVYLIFIPALAVLAGTLLLLERRQERLRPWLSVAWVLVFDLLLLGVMTSNLGEVADASRLGFLLLGLVVATARNLVAGALNGGMAALAYGYLLVSNEQLVLLDPALFSACAAFAVAGLLTGFMSVEAEYEREERAVQTAELREQLVDLGQHLSRVLSCVGSGVLVVDETERVTTFNPAAQRILGLPEHQVIGRVVSNLAALSQLGPALGGGAADPQARSDVEFLRPDGARVRVGYAVTPLEDRAGRRLGQIIVFQDVTLLRDYEVRMQRQEKLAALGRLVSGIAHEFGNLLGGAKGHVDFALSGGPEDAVEALPIVRDTLTRSLETVEHLLRFARRVPVHRVPDVHLGEVLERALGLMRVEVERVGLTVERVGEEVSVTADAGQLEQVFVNFVINACHALAEEKQRRLRVSMSHADGVVRIVFEDSGPGVPEQVRDRIFEPFFTTKGALGGSSTPGTGLGLSEALGVVESHDGSIELDQSPELGGARFTILLRSEPTDDGSTAGEAQPVNQG
jgi:PAS domain S-box-containing protein